MHVRSLLFPLTLTMAFNPALAPSPALAQQNNPLPACTGEIHIVRVSDIKPGKMETFLKATVDQQAWYKSKGGTDQIVVMKVMKQAADKSWAYSDIEALTDHIEPADRKPGTIAHDAGYDSLCRAIQRQLRDQVRVRHLQQQNVTPPLWRSTYGGPR